MRCDGCGEPFEPRRRDQRFCSAACRGQRFARDRLERAQQALAALDALAALEPLRPWLEAEVARWEPAAVGRARRRGDAAP